LALDQEESVRRLRAVAKVPLFGYFESSLGKGIVGGRLYPDVTLGVEGARAAIRILKGEAPNAIAPVVLEENAPAYDWRELQRFGIGEDRLPTGSEVRYRPESLWQSYRWHLAAAIALLFLQAALISGLVLQRARNRRAEAERNRAEAEDAVQETLTQALQLFHRYQPGTNCRAWLLTILQNVLNNRRRARQRSPGR
jgi:hypothetical protein